MKHTTKTHLATAAGLALAAAFGAATVESVLADAASREAVDAAAPATPSAGIERHGLDADGDRAAHDDDGDGDEEFAAHERRADEAIRGSDDLIARLRADGYTGIHDLERDGGRWKLDARDPSGRRVELYVDGRSGKVLRSDDD